ncbi:phosphoribosylformylglycinamidine cyclo-ligase [Euzebya sp.]|uniref:phosphoribosylformylglycinamidine cyclo-ligase n=1 Tax=Euzebya sp. TaxID=1971409 RepID=UPI00351482FB
MGETYAGAGVDLDAADAVVEGIRPHVERTHRPEVLDGIGGFGGLFAIDTARWREPVMVTATDGVGTKLELARRLGRHDTVGIDLVAMVVDDIVVSGAEPQVFLDYIAIGRLDPDVVTEVVAGIAEGCVQAGCALAGGETAEHPGVMPAGDYDLAGFGVGLVERSAILGPHRVAEGDVLVGMPASGLHSNGYSLVRALVDGLDLADGHGLDRPLGEELLTPTALYTRPCLALAAEGLVNALCHVTGGGLPGNLPRVLPAGLGADVGLGSWTPAPVFGLLQRLGSVATDEMFRVFNMGVGMVAVVPATEVDAALAVLGRHGVEGWVLGRVTTPAGVRLR